MMWIVEGRVAGVRMWKQREDEKRNADTTKEKYYLCKRNS